MEKYKTFLFGTSKGRMVLLCVILALAGLVRLAGVVINGGTDSERRVLMMRVKDSIGPQYEGIVHGEVICSDGMMYEMPDDFIQLMDDDRLPDDWNEKVEEAIQEAEPRQMNRVDFSHIKSFVNKEKNYVGKSMKEYEGGVLDWGEEYLYAVYYDGSDQPQYELLCKYGELSACLDNRKVRKFANQMIRKEYFYTEYGFKYQNRMFNTISFELHSFFGN